MDVRDPEERSLLAAEYVLGTLSGDERREFASLAAQRPEVASEVHAWEIRLAPLALSLTPVAPRPIVWFKLLQLTAERQKSSTPRRSASFTRGWAVLATAASLLLAIGLYLQVNRPPPAPVVVTKRVEVPVAAKVYVALLQVPKSTMHWTVSVVPQRKELLVRAGGEAPAGVGTRDAELWLITDGGPVSLGVIPKSGELRRALPAQLAVTGGGTLAVSLEPAGGSPTGQPTGPVVTTASILQAS